MRRIASHYIFWKQLYAMHYLEIEEGRIRGIYPLRGEIAGTEFHNGLLIPMYDGLDLYKEICAQKDLLPVYTIRDQIKNWVLNEELFIGDPVGVYHISQLQLTAAELCADNSCGNRYIQRL